MLQERIFTGSHHAEGEYVDYSKSIVVSNGGFNWKQFKLFLKQLRRTKKCVRFYYIEDNSIGLPAREVAFQRFRVNGFKMELWEQSAIYHIEIWNSLHRIDMEIPANADHVANEFSFGYEWRDGPTHRVMFYTTCPKGTKAWKSIVG